MYKLRFYLCKLPATHFGPQRGKLHPGQRKAGPLIIIIKDDEVEDDEDDENDEDEADEGDDSEGGEGGGPKLLDGGRKETQPMLPMYLF